MRSRGCWDAPGAVQEGVAQRGEDGDVVRPGGGDVGTDAAEGLEPAHAPPASADLGLELGHPDGLLAAVVGPVDVEVGGEVQHLVDPLGHPFGQLVGLLAGAFDARALAATPCSAVLAYRPRSWPGVAGGRLTALASTAASTARRALVRVWRICAAQAWPCGSASQTACRSRIRCALCRYRHNAHYAEPPIMPMSRRKPLWPGGLMSSSSA